MRNNENFCSSVELISLPIEFYKLFLQYIIIDDDIDEVCMWLIELHILYEKEFGQWNGLNYLVPIPNRYFK